jgi:molybdopterin synthase catalytic subunit
VTHAYPEVSVQEADFDVSILQSQLLGAGCEAGAIVSFTGFVRRNGESGETLTMELEHYPGMTERSIQKIVDEARHRWHVTGVRVVHRIGTLQAGQQIVYVGVGCRHRGDAFQACEFIMDYLKTRAPFWKKENAGSEEHWVQSRESDSNAARRWEE